MPDLATMARAMAVKQSDVQEEWPRLTGVGHAHEVRVSAVLMVWRGSLRREGPSDWHRVDGDGLIIG